MDFKSIKEHAGLAAVTIIIAWSGAQLKSLNDTAGKLAEEMIGMKKDVTFNSYRIDQHRDTIRAMQEKNTNQDVSIGELKARLFQRHGG